MPDNKVLLLSTHSEIFFKELPNPESSDETVAETLAHSLDTLVEFILFPKSINQSIALFNPSVPIDVVCPTELVYFISTKCPVESVVIDIFVPCKSL